MNAKNKSSVMGGIVMDKRIEGTFANQEMVIDEITHLIKHEG